MRYSIKIPVGNSCFCGSVREVCEKAQAYKRGGVRPAHFIVDLDSGEGRTTLVEFMADCYDSYGIINSAGHLDEYVEVSLGDGTPEDVRRVFGEIESAAVYSNRYTGVVAIDVCGLACHIHEKQVEEFITGINEVCKNACVIFFLHSEPGRNEERLAEKICERIGNIKHIGFEPYTKGELCEIILGIVTDRGIEVCRREGVTAVLMSLIDSLGIGTASETIPVANELTLEVDYYSEQVPYIDETVVKNVQKRVINERSETI